MVSRGGENNGVKREKMSEFVGFSEASKFAGICIRPENTRELTIKKVS